MYRLIHSSMHSHMCTFSMRLIFFICISFCLRMIMF
uniref:Uncharacterized protein n=1 Tax=Anguilla anguilla TaxID=7936 RepID=A0A0E9Q0R6_ANGAN